MRILYITQKFHPEEMAAERFLRQVVELGKLGHRVTVLTAMPSYPRGRIFDAYRGRWLCRESVEGCDVIRVRAFVTPNHGIVLRALSYASFTVLATLVGLFITKPHLVMAAVPNPGTELAGLLVARARGSRILLEMVDLIPENLSFIGIKKHSTVARILGGYYRVMYRLVDWIAVLCPAAARSLTDKGVSADRILLLPNGADDDLLDGSLGPTLRKRHDWDGQFIVLYAGSFSPYYEVPNLVEAARILAIGSPAIRLVLLGDGADWDRVAESVRASGLSNVSLMGCVTRQEMVGYFHAADLFIFSMVADPLPQPYREILTAKLCEYLYVGKPIVAVENGQIAGNLLQSIGAGTIVAPKDPRALATAITSYATDAAAWHRSQAAAGAFGRAKLRRSEIVANFVHELAMKMDGAR